MTITLMCLDKTEDGPPDYVFRWNANPPVAHIEDIDSTGLAVVKFNSTMAERYALTDDEW